MPRSFSRSGEGRTREGAVRRTTTSSQPSSPPRCSVGVAYLADVLSPVQTHPASRIDELAYANTLVDALDPYACAHPAAAVLQPGLGWHYIFLGP